MRTCKLFKAHRLFEQSGDGGAKMSALEAAAALLFPEVVQLATESGRADSSRDVLIAYIKQVKDLTRVRNGATRSWRFAPVATRGQVVFRSAPDMIDLARAAGLRSVSQLKADDGGGKGFALYAIDLSQKSER